MFKEVVEVIDIMKEKTPPSKVSGGSTCAREGIPVDKVKIKFNRQKSCSCCQSSPFCGKVDKTPPSKVPGGSILVDKEIAIDNCGLFLEKGDKIEVGIEGRKTILVSLITFLIPAVIFVSFLVLFKNFSQILSFFLAISAIFVYYLIVKIAVKRKEKYFNLEILRKL